MGAIRFDGGSEAGTACRGPSGSLNNWENKSNCKRLFVCNGRLIKGDPFSPASLAGLDEGVDEGRLVVQPCSRLNDEIFWAGPLRILPFGDGAGEI